MSPILDLQQRLQEVGRIRMGAKKEWEKEGRKGTRPAKLQFWRLTSRDQQRLEAVAGIYGGEVKPWAERDGEYEIYTKSDQLQILIIPGQALTQWWEMWSGGGCLRRCDGHHEYIGDTDCLCPAEYDERAEQSSANPPTACKPTSRLAVLLPEVPGIGHWRLETHSYYAAVELAAAHQLLEEATRRGALLPARLRIDIRKKVAGGQTTVYPVPVVDVDVSTGQLLQLGQGMAEGEVLQLNPAPAAAAEVGQGFQPVPAPEGTQPGLQAGLAAVQGAPPPKPPRANSVEPVGDDTPLPADDFGVPVDEGDEPPVDAPAAPQQPAQAPEQPAAAPQQAATAPEPAQAGTPAQGATPELSVQMANMRQRRMMWATVRERGLEDDQVRKILQEVTGQESSAAIPAGLFDAVYTAIQATEPAGA